MVDLSGVDLISWFFFLGFIVVCFIIIIIVTKLEERYHKALVDKKQKMVMKNVRGMKGNLPSKEEKQKGFVVGQVYQMEDGTLAKYMEDGKFRKIKEE